MYRAESARLGLVGGGRRIVTAVDALVTGNTRPCARLWKFQGCFAHTGGTKHVCVGPHAFIPAPNTFRVQLVYTLLGQRIENVFHVLSGGGVAITDANRIEAVFAAWWTATGRVQASTSVSLVLIVMDALSVESGLHAEYTSGWTAPGLINSQPSSPILTTKIKFSTSFSGRSFRGGIFWPGIPQTQVLSGLILASYRDAIVAACNTLRTNLSAGGDALAIASYCHNHAWRSTAIVTQVVNCSGHTTINRQGRRAVPGA